MPGTPSCLVCLPHRRDCCRERADPNPIIEGMGFQWVNNTERFHDLPTPIEWPDKTVFTTSMTHQLHCLFAVVQTYSGLKSNTEIPDDHHWHMIHCFDYMRQAIMCSADMALEGLETTFPDHNGGSDGWDSKHGTSHYCFA